APVFDSVPPVSVLEGDTLVILVHAVDPEGGTILMGTLNSILNAVFVDSGNGFGTVTYRPSFLQSGTDTLRILAVDNGTPLATQTLKIAITTLDKNQPPNLWPIGSRTVLAGDSIKIRVVATDSTAPAGNRLYMAAINLPANATYQDSGGGIGKFKFKPTSAQIGSFNVTFIVTDNGNPALADLETVTITVQSQNRAPVLASIGAKLVNEGDSIQFNVSATDPDGTIPFLTCAPLPLNATFVDSGNGHGRFQFKPSFVQSGLYSITFTASDGLLSAQEQVLVQVKEAGNQAPILGQMADSVSVYEKSTILILVSATDPDGGNPALAVTPLLPNATFADSGNGTGVFRMTPDYWQDSVYTLLFTATDVLGKKDSAYVVLTVIDIGNQRPFFLPIATQTVIEKNSLIFSVTAKDSDLTIPTLVARPLPVGAAFADTGNGIGVFSWVPDYTDAGTHNVYFVATDAESSAYKDSVLVPIVVLDRTRAPQFNASSTNGIAVTMALGDSITIWYHAFDPDGPAPKMTVTNLRPHMSYVDSGNGFVYLTYKPALSDLPGVYSVNFIATDSVYDTVSVSLNQVFNVGFKNVAPVLEPIGPKTVLEGDSLIFVVTATDSNGTVPFVSASNLPTNATFTGLGSGLGRFRFLPSYTQAGIYYPLFKAQDGSGAIDTERVAITVQEAGDRPPVWVTTFPSDTIRLNFVSSYTLRMAATDLDNPLLTLVAVGAPAHSTFTDSLNNAASFIFNPDSTQVGQVYPILFIAQDGTLADTAVVIIQVLSFLRGDWNSDRVVDIIDVVSQVNYTFRGGPDPVPFDLANYNGDAIINVLDLVIMIDYVFRNGPLLPP
ncbi:MAG: hypothetical protein HY304_06690, partial [candidate division Zixibacteria bacterium]|nr:hypothetical protein [candidate division Zixibacteria bacterium]